jgi:phosphohistidine phosphatase
MKTLALLRHAKAGRSAPGLGDFERPLTPRGAKAAPCMGRALRTLGLNPDLVLCSQARRARETWDLVAPELDGAPQVQINRALYLAAPGALLDAVRKAEAAAGLVLLIGHNPGLEWLAGALCGPQSDPGAVRGLAAKFPTSGLAVLTFEAPSWRDVEPGRGRLIHFLRPGDLD